MKKALQAIYLTLTVVCVCSCFAQDTKTMYSENNYREFWDIFETICLKYYSKLKDEDSNLLVFMEVSSSSEPWVGGDPLIPIPKDLIGELSKPGISFYKDEELDSIIPSIEQKPKIIRATMFPNAILFDQKDGMVKVPVKDGDIMKWRHRYFLVQKKDSRWEFIGVE